MLGKDKLDMVIKRLAMPYMTVSVEKTIQEKQYEPRRISVQLSVPAEEMTPAFLKSLMDMVEAEIEARVNLLLVKQPKEKKEEEQKPEKEKEQAIEKQAEEVEEQKAIDKAEPEKIEKPDL